MESTLTLKKSDLDGAAGFFLGYGRGADNSETAWTTQQQNAIDFCVKSGLRQFYQPHPMNGGAAHDWSFLHPVALLALASGAKTVDLPDDFGGFEGQLTLSSSSSSAYYPVDLTSVGKVYAQEAMNSTTTGTPRMACEEPLKGTGAARGQQFQLHVWPIADAAYTIRGQYYLLGSALDGTRPYAYGGSAHSETIQAAVLAACELYLDGIRGPQWEYYQERLSASISVDSRHKPQNLGYVGDNSDGRRMYMPRRNDQAVVTFNGTEY